MDVLRALSRGGMGDFLQVVEGRVQITDVSIAEKLSQPVQQIRVALSKLAAFVQSLLSTDREAVEATARDIAYFMSSLYISSLLIDFANWSKTDRDVAIAAKWVKERLVNLPLDSACATRREAERIIALDCDPHTGKARGDPAFRAKF